MGKKYFHVGLKNQHKLKKSTILDLLFKVKYSIMREHDIFIKNSVEQRRNVIPCFSGKRIRNIL